MKTDTRVIVTKRMLREGMLRCLEAKPLSKITVSDLCRESGVHRATFYNHYDAPAAILRELAIEYFGKLESLYASAARGPGGKGEDAGIEACMAFIAERKPELRVLFSGHAEHFLSSVATEIINEKAERLEGAPASPGGYGERLLRTAARASAVFGFIQIRITADIDRPPKELARILMSVLRGGEPE